MEGMRNGGKINLVSAFSETGSAAGESVCCPPRRARRRSNLSGGTRTRRRVTPPSGPRFATLGCVPSRRTVLESLPLGFDEKEMNWPPKCLKWRNQFVETRERCWEKNPLLERSVPCSSQAGTAQAAPESVFRGVGEAWGKDEPHLPGQGAGEEVSVSGHSCRQRLIESENQTLMSFR